METDNERDAAFQLYTLVGFHGAQDVAVYREDADALAGIEAWGVEQWRTLDSTLAAIESALR